MKLFLNAKLTFNLILALMGVSLSLMAGPIPLSDEAKSLKKGIYQHYKGNLYEVVSVGHHSETLDELVIYRALYDDYGYWVRPRGMFQENIVDADNEVVPRFRYIGEPGNF